MQRVIIPISAMLLLSACLGSRRDGMPVQPVVIQAPPAAVASPEQIAGTAKDMASRIDSSRSAASSIQDRADGLGARVPEAKPDAGAISASAASIVADQDALRRTLASSEAEVVKMRGEVDRLRAETAADKQRLAALTIAREEDKKAHLEALKAKDAQISAAEERYRSANSWIGRSVSVFGVGFVILGLAMLYYKANKLEGGGAVVVGILAVFLGGVLPEISGASHRFALPFVIGSVAVVGAFAAYYAVRTVRQARGQKGRLPCSTPV